MYAADVVPGGGQVSLGAAGITAELRPTAVSGGIMYDLRVRNRTGNRFVHKELKARFPRTGTGPVTIGGIVQPAPLKVRQSWRPPNAGITGIKFGFFYDISSGTNVLRTEGPATVMSPAWTGTTDGIARADGNAYGILEFWQRQPRSIEVTASEVILTFYSAADAYVPTFGDGEPLRPGEDAWDRFGIFPASFTDSQVVMELEHLPVLSQAERDAIIARFGLAPFGLTNTDPIMGPQVNPLLRKYDQWQGTSWDKSYADQISSRQWLGETDSQRTTLFSHLAKGGVFGFGPSTYAWRDYGDIYWADGQSSGHYDWLRSAFRHYVKGGAGATEALRWAMASARHRTAVDQAWAHAGNGFTEGLQRYEKNDHGEGASSQGEKASHTWDEGLFIAAAVTGDPWIREAALQTAEGLWKSLRGANVLHTELGNAEVRALGWPLLALVTAFRETNDLRYWTKAKEIAANFVYLENRDGQNGYIEAHDCAYPQSSPCGGYTTGSLQSPFHYGYTSRGLILFAEEAFRQNDMPPGYIEMLGRMIRWLSTPMPNGPYFPPGTQGVSGGWGGQSGPDGWCDPRRVCRTGARYFLEPWTNQVLTDFFAWAAVRIDSSYAPIARQVFSDSARYAVNSAGLVGYLTPNFPNSETKLLGRIQLIGDYAARWLAGVTGEPPPPSPSAPLPPSNLTAAARSNTQVGLSWVDNSTNEDGFRVERQGPGEPAFREIFQVGPDITSTTDGTVLGGRQYAYRVRAFNRGGESPYSNIATVATPDIPNAPSRIRTVDEAPTTVSIRWDDNSTNETGFVVERSVNPGGGFAPVAPPLPPNTVEYWDPGLTPETVYWYRVKAITATGESPPSELAQAYTPAAAQPNIRVRLSKPRLIRDGALGPAYEGGYPDAPMSLMPGDNPDQPRRICADHHCIENPFSTSPVYGPPILQNNWPFGGAHGSEPAAGATDHCGDWFVPTMRKNAQGSTPDRIHGFFHVEGDVDATPEGRCGYGPPNDQIVQGIEYYYSDDNGNTWTETNLPALTSYWRDRRGPAYPARSWTGVANPALIEEGNYLYMFYKENGENWVPSEYFGLAVARAPKTTDGVPSAPGQTPWQKYYNGGFTEPGLGGESTFLLWGFHTPMGVGKNDFFAAQGTPYWLLAQTNARNVLRLSRDLTSWNYFRGFDVLPEDPPSLTYGNEAVTHRQFPSLHFIPGGTTPTETRAKLYYMYKPHGRDLQERTLFVRDALFTVGASPLPVQLPLIRYARTDPRVETQTTNEFAFGRSGGSYQEDRDLGFVFAGVPENVPSRRLLNCYTPATGDYYAAAGSACDAPGDELVEYLGYVYRDGQPNTTGLYQCYDSVRNERFVSNDVRCEGNGAGVLLGYLEPPPVPNPQLTGIVPSSITNDVNRTVRLNGERFAQDAVVIVFIGGSPVPYPRNLTTVVSDRAIDILVPAGVTPATYELAVLNPGAQLASNRLPIEVRALPSQPDTEPPQVRIIAPPAGSALSGSVVVAADATDNIGVAGVQFVLDGGSLGQEDTTPPYSVTWDTLAGGDGPHTLSARARDAAGNVGIAPDVQVTVQNAPLPPVNLSGRAASATEIELSWTNQATNATGIRVERSASTTDPFSTVPGAGNLSPGATSFTDTGLASATAYRYRVVAFNASGSSNPSNIVSVTMTSASAPSAPSNLAAIALSPTQVRLTWSDNSANEDGFKIERRGPADPGFREILQVGANIAAAVDGTVRGGETYAYRVRAFRQTAHSGYSNTATVVMPSGAGPNPPSNLEVTGTTHISVALSWRDNSTDENGFKIEHSLEPATGFVEVDVVPANVTVFTDTDLIPETRYYYRVRAFHAQGESAYSNIAEGRTASPPPPPPPPSPPGGGGGGSGGGGSGGGGAPPPAATSSLPQPIARPYPPSSASSSPSSPRVQFPQVFTEFLRRGSRHSQVRLLQEFLAHDRTFYPEGLVTGYFGLLTERAVQRFQDRYAIVRRGEAEYGATGTSTREKLNELAAPVVRPSSGGAFTKDLSPGMRDDDVRRLQAFLNRDAATRVSEHGPGSPGNETDFYGERTVGAVQAFQRQQGIIDSGSPMTTGFGRFGPRTRAKVNDFIMRQP